MFQVSGFLLSSLPANKFQYETTEMIHHNMDPVLNIITMACFGIICKLDENLRHVSATVFYKDLGAKYFGLLAKWSLRTTQLCPKTEKL